MNHYHFDYTPHASPTTPAVLHPPASTRTSTLSPTLSPLTPATPPDIINLDSDDDDVAAPPRAPDHTPLPPTSTPTTPAPPPAEDLDDDDVCAIAVIQPSASYPHARSDCLLLPFDPSLTDAALSSNAARCPNCFCFVCDDPAARCPSWPTHCMASSLSPIWRNLRTRRRARPTETLPPVPAIVLPPSLHALAPPPRAVRLKNGTIHSFFDLPPPRPAPPPRAPPALCFSPDFARRRRAVAVCQADFVRQAAAAGVSSAASHARAGVGAGAVVAAPVFFTPLVVSPGEAKLRELRACVEGIAGDADKFYGKGNKAAGVRLRKRLQGLKVLSQELREAIQKIKTDIGDSGGEGVSAR